MASIHVYLLSAIKFPSLSFEMGEPLYINAMHTEFYLLIQTKKLSRSYITKSEATTQHLEIRH
jgi:hypothetical protein